LSFNNNYANFASEYNYKMFSKACEYAIKAMIYLAVCQHENRRAGIREIAESIASPEAFTAKILQQLVRSRLLSSVKGPHGGFELAKPADQTMMIQVVEAIDGDGMFVNCVLGLDECSGSNPCPVHHKMLAIRDHLTGMLSVTSVGEIELGMLKNGSVLKN
jgi:Rrf2 family iron-sulfur cluster assembly transcriptional regulator